MTNSIASYSPAFDKIAPPDTKIQIVADQTGAHEGPVYVADGHYLLYTTSPVPGPTAEPRAGFRPNIEIRKLDLHTGKISVWLKDSNMGNGMTLDRQGRLLICEQGSFGSPARISRAALPDGRPEALINSWWGLEFNSPNDIVVRRDGTIWFTDPSYGALQGFKSRPQLGDFVYRFDPRVTAPEARLTVVAEGFSKPNGLAFSPDETVLYVTDSGAIQSPGSFHPALPHHVVAFDVDEVGALCGRRPFATTTPGVPDGIKLDIEGNVYLGTGDGVQVFDSSGQILGKILIDGGIANFTFGGQDNKTLYLCADPIIYQVQLQATGAGC